MEGVNPASVAPLPPTAPALQPIPTLTSVTTRPLSTFSPTRPDATRSASTATGIVPSAPPLRQSSGLVPPVRAAPEAPEASLKPPGALVPTTGTSIIVPPVLPSRPLTSGIAVPILTSRPTIPTSSIASMIVTSMLAPNVSAPAAVDALSSEPSRSSAVLFPAVFGFGAAVAIGAAGLILAVKSGGSLFRDGQRLVLFLIYLIALLWGVANFLAVSKLVPDELQQCQISISVSTVFDQLTRFLGEQYLLWSISRMQGAKTPIIPQFLILARLVLGGVYVVFVKPDSGVCFLSMPLTAIALATIAADAVIILILAIYGFTNLSGGPGLPSFMVSLLGLGAWTGLSLFMIMGQDGGSLERRIALPGIGLVIFLVLLTVTSRRLLTGKETRSGSVEAPSPRAIGIGLPITGVTYPLPASYDDIKGSSRLAATTVRDFGVEEKTKLDEAPDGFSVTATGINSSSSFSGRNGDELRRRSPRQPTNGMKTPTAQAPKSAGLPLGRRGTTGPGLPTTPGRKTPGISSVPPPIPRDDMVPGLMKSTYASSIRSRDKADKETPDTPSEPMPSLKRTKSGLPGNPKARAERAAADQFSGSVESQAQTVMFLSDIKYNNPNAVEDIIKKAAAIVKNPTTPGPLTTSQNPPTPRTTRLPSLPNTPRANKGAFKTSMSPKTPPIPAVPKVPEQLRNASRKTEVAAVGQEASSLFAAESGKISDETTSPKVDASIVKTPRSVESMLHRPRPVSRRTVDARSAHQHTRSNSNSCSGKKITLHSDPANPTALPPLPPPPQSPSVSTRALPNNTRSMTFEEKMTRFYAPGEADTHYNFEADELALDQPREAPSSKQVPIAVVIATQVNESRATAAIPRNPSFLDVPDASGNDDEGDDDDGHSWGIIHSPARAVKVQQIRADPVNVRRQSDKGDADGVLTIKLDAPSTPLFAGKSDSTKGQLSAKWHRRPGDDRLSFSIEREKRTSRRVVPPTPVLIRSSLSAQDMVAVHEVQPQADVESPSKTIAHIRNQLRQFEEPNRDSTGSRDGQRLTLLQNLSHERGSLDNRWAQMQSDLGRDSISSYHTEPIDDSLNLLVPPVKPTHISSWKSSSPIQRHVFADQNISSSPSTSMLRSSAWETRLAQAQADYSDHAPETLQGRPPNFLNMETALASSPPLPSMIEQPRYAEKSVVEAYSFRCVATSPISVMWDHASIIPAPFFLGTGLWNPPTKKHGFDLNNVELPALSVRLRRHYNNDPLTIESTSLWQKPELPKEHQPGLFWGYAPIRRPKLPVKKRVTKPPPRKSCRITQLPDIIESPRPLSGEPDVLGIFQLPTGKRSHTVPPSSPDTGKETLGGVGMKAKLVERAMQLEAAEYNSDIFDQYANSEDESEEESAEQAILEIENLLKSNEVSFASPIVPEFDDVDDLPDPIAPLQMRRSGSSRVELGRAKRHVIEYLWAPSTVVSKFSFTPLWANEHENARQSTSSIIEGQNAPARKRRLPYRQIDPEPITSTSLWTPRVAAKFTHEPLWRAAAPAKPVKPVPTKLVIQINDECISEEQCNAEQVATPATLSYVKNAFSSFWAKSSPTEAAAKSSSRSTETSVAKKSSSPESLPARSPGHSTLLGVFSGIRGVGASLKSPTKPTMPTTPGTPPFDASIKHPVFAASVLTRSGKDYHPAATGYIWGVEKVHPACYGSIKIDLSIPIEHVHPAVLARHEHIAWISSRQDSSMVEGPSIEQFDQPVGDMTSMVAVEPVYVESIYEDFTFGDDIHEPVVDDVYYETATDGLELLAPTTYVEEKINTPATELLENPMMQAATVEGTAVEVTASDALRNFDASVKHPVFATTKLATACPTYHPAATGYVYGIDKVHPCFFGSKPIDPAVALDQLHPAISEYAARKLRRMQRSASRERSRSRSRSRSDASSSSGRSSRSRSRGDASTRSSRSQSRSRPSSTTSQLDAPETAAATALHTSIPVPAIPSEFSQWAKPATVAVPVSEPVAPVAAGPTTPVVQPEPEPVFVDRPMFNPMARVMSMVSPAQSRTSQLPTPSAAPKPRPFSTRNTTRTSPAAASSGNSLPLDPRTGSKPSYSTSSASTTRFPRSSVVSNKHATGSRASHSRSQSLYRMSLQNLHRANLQQRGSATSTPQQQQEQPDQQQQQILTEYDMEAQLRLEEEEAAARNLADAEIVYVESPVFSGEPYVWSTAAVDEDRVTTGVPPADRQSYFAAFGNNFAGASGR